MAQLKGENNEITGKLDPKYWVKKSDPLVLMRSVPFTLGELKILDTYISRINAADDTRRTVIFTKEEYEELMGITCANYRALQKHTKGMLGKVVELQMPNKDYLQFVLFTKAYYHKDEYGKPIIEITCTEEAKDLFFCINKYHYFKYALENIISLTRKASYLLYVYIRHNRYRGEWDIALDELRDTVLDCKGQESYLAFKEFKRAVLDPAVKEVNKKTDCHFAYEAIKRGRRVAKIKFIIQTVDERIDVELENIPGQMSLIDFNDSESDENEIDYGGELANLLGSAACDDEFSPEQIRVLQDLIIKAVPNGDNMERCDYLIHQIHKMNAYDKDHKTVKNRFNYLRRMIEKDIKENENAYSCFGN